MQDKRPENTAEVSAEHTPGPWYVVPRPWSDSATIINTTEDPHVGVLICDTSLPDMLERDEPDKQTQRANARLIAAAPQLLQATRRAFEVLHHVPINNPAISEAYEECMRALAQVDGVDTALEASRDDEVARLREQVGEMKEDKQRLRDIVDDLCDMIVQLTDVDDLVEAVNAEPERFAGFRGALERAGQVLETTR